MTDILRVCMKAGVCRGETTMEKEEARGRRKD
jgi:hypothetical protein